MMIYAPTTLLLYLGRTSPHLHCVHRLFFMALYIIIGTVALLIILVCYTFISHGVEKRRAQRQRLITALKVREHNFRYLATGLPPHFLPADLNTLVYRALIDTCEQLAKLDPKNPSHQADAVLFSSELAAIKPAPKSRVRLDSPAKIKEVRQYLQELVRFISQQEALKLIKPVQAAVYHDQIKRLALQISIDSYMLQAKYAQQQQKPRLAIHFYTLARKLLIAENASHRYDKQIAQMQAAITKLEEAVATQAQPNGKPATDGASKLTNKEWEHFGEDEWKKKQDYD